MKPERSKVSTRDTLLILQNEAQNVKRQYYISQGFLNVHRRVIARCSLPKQSLMLPGEKTASSQRTLLAATSTAKFLDFKKAVLYQRSQGTVTGACGVGTGA
jgi:hypothetical protein